MSKGFKASMIAIFVGVLYVLIGYYFIKNNTHYLPNPCPPCPEGAWCGLCVPKYDPSRLNNEALATVELWKGILTWPLHLNWK